MKSDGELIIWGLGVTFCLALFIYRLFGWYDCETKGGVYVWDSFQCAAEFKEKP